MKPLNENGNNHADIVVNKTVEYLDFQEQLKSLVAKMTDVVSDIVYHGQFCNAEIHEITDKIGISQRGNMLFSLKSTLNEYPLDPSKLSQIKKALASNTELKYVPPVFANDQFDFGEVIEFCTNIFKTNPKCKCIIMGPDVVVQYEGKYAVSPSTKYKHVVQIHAKNVFKKLCMVSDAKQIRQIELRMHKAYGFIFTVNESSKLLFAFRD